MNFIAAALTDNMYQQDPGQKRMTNKQQKNATTTTTTTIHKQKHAMHKMKEMMFNLSFGIYLQTKLQAHIDKH